MVGVAILMQQGAAWGGRHTSRKGHGMEILTVQATQSEPEGHDQKLSSHMASRGTTSRMASWL